MKRSLARAATGLTLVLCLVLGLAACGADLTPEAYEKLKAGMTQDEVEAILGSGTPVDEVGGPLGKIATKSKFEWTSGDRRILVTFTNGKLSLYSKTGF